MNAKADPACTNSRDACASLPELVRMNYFHGQLITDRDLRTEQDYFRARLRHANRCLHGYGVLCGLELEAVPEREECRPEDEERNDELRHRVEKYDRKIEELRAAAKEDGADVDAIEKRIEALEAEREAIVRDSEAPPRRYPPRRGDEPHRPRHVVTLGCGAAIDCEGNDIIVRNSVPVDLDKLLACAPADEEEGSHEEAPGRHAHASEPGGSISGRDQEPDGGPPTDQGDDGVRYAWLSICWRECGLEPTRPFELDECATSVRCHDARIAEGWRLTASWKRPREDDRCETCCSACRDPCLLLARIRIDPDGPVLAEDIDHGVRRRFGLYEPTVISGISWLHGFTYSLAAADLLLGTGHPDTGLEIRFSRPVRADSLEQGVIDLWRIEGGKGGRGESRNMEAELIVPPSSDGMVDRFYISNSSRERVQYGDRIFVTVRGAFILDSCCRAVEGAHLGGRVPRLPGDDEATRRAMEEEAKADPPAACVRPPHGPVPWTTGAGGNFESWFYISEA